MNENLGSDFTRSAIESLRQSVYDLGTVINGLPQKMVLNVDFAKLTDVVSQSIQLDCSEMIDAVQRALSDSLPLWSESMRKSLAEQLSDDAYLETIRDFSMSILNGLDIEEPEEYPEIPAEKVLPVLDRMERGLPEEATVVINTKVAVSKTSDNKISLGNWIEIVGILVTIVLFFAGQVLSDAHDRKEEAHWAATDKYQQEMLELQEQEAERSESFQQSVEEHFKIVENTDERIAKALEMLANQSVELDDQSQGVVDSVDSQDEIENYDPIQDGLQ